MNFLLVNTPASTANCYKTLSSDIVKIMLKHTIKNYAKKQFSLLILHTSSQKGFTQLLLILILLTGIIVAVYLTQFTQIFKPRANEGQLQGMPEHIIGKTMVDGKPFLYNKASGRIFIPRGAIYDSGQIDGTYDPIKTEQDFQKMELDGYNSVRTSVVPWRVGNANSPGLNPQVLDNLIDYLQKAKNHHLFVLLQVGGWPGNPVNGYEPPGNQNDPFRTFDESGVMTDSGYPNYYLLSPQALEARKKYLFRELKARNAPLENIWTYELGEGELNIKLDAKPFVGVSGPVQTNAGTFNIANMPPTDRIHVIDKSVIIYVDTLTDAIKSEDPTALVSFQMFPPVLHTPPGQSTTNLYVPAKWLMATPDMREGDLHGVKADLAGLSLYPNYGGYNFECQISSFQIPGVGGGCGYPVRTGTNTRPIYVMEMGYNYRNPEQENVEKAADTTAPLVDWMKMECTAGVRGWFMFTYNFPRSYGNYFNALEDGEVINNAIKPVNFPNVCDDNLDSGPGVGEGKVDSVPIYNFWEKANPKSLFYTASENEKAYLLKTNQWGYGSNTWYSSTKPGDGLKPVYALSLKSYGGTHMYTISEAEKQQLINTGLWEDRGIVWYSSEEPKEGLIPVFRFKSKTDDNLHFFIAQPLGYDETGKKNMADQSWIYEDKNPVWYDSQFAKLPSSFSPSSSPSPSPSPAEKVGDLNDDSSVDALDFGVFVRDYRDQNLRSDFNGNNEVDIFDFNIFIQNIGK